MDALLPPPVWDHEFEHWQRPTADWLWLGFIPRGRIALLTAIWKSGKTTLLSLLLARRNQGGVLAGQPVTAGKTSIVSEEDIDLWRERSQRLGFGGNVCFHCQPFHGRPTREHWDKLMETLLREQQEHGVDLVVIDTIASFLPGGDENRSSSMLSALLPLRSLTRAGLTVLLLHHPRKGAILPGQASRGSGALPAFVDLFFEMTVSGDPNTSRRRILNGFSRFAQTPRRLLIELNPEATDYLVLPDPEAEDFKEHWRVLQMVLEDAEDKLTRRQILDQWPPDFAKPCDMTLYRWLDRGLDLNYFAREGTGRRTSPFRYWLPEKEKQWQLDPLYVLNHTIAKERILLDRALRTGKWPKATG